MRTETKGPVCLVCLKVFEDKGDCDRTSYKKRSLSPTFQNFLHLKTENEATEVGDFESNLYFRFLNFTRKYLGLESSGSELVRAAKAKILETGKDVRAFCERCEKNVSRICDLYAELQKVKLQLLWRLDQLGDTLSTKSSKTDPPNARRKRTFILRTEMNVGKTAVAALVPHFRTKLKIQCKLKAKKNCGPFVSLARGLDPEERKFTHAATKETLMRLIVIYALGSNCSNVSAEEKESTSVALEGHNDSSNLIQNSSSLIQPEACVNYDDIKMVEDCGVETNILVKKESELEEPSLPYDACNDEFADFADSAPPSPEVDSDTDDEWAPDSETAATDLGNSLHLSLKRRRSQRINTGQTMGDECMKEESVETEDVLKSDYDEGGSKDDVTSSDEMGGRKRAGRKRGQLLPKLLVCPYEDCRKSFAIQRQYAFHLLTIHKRKISCSECGLKFKQLTELTRHMKTVHRKPRTVPWSWLMRKGKGGGRSKLKSLTKEKDEKEEKNRGSGRPTLKSLSKEKNEKSEKKRGRPRLTGFSKGKYTKTFQFCYCDVCGKSFRKLCDLRQHMNSEHNDCYPCLKLECQASFSTGKELREHLQRTHELKDVERFQCVICLRGFACQQYRDIHAKTVHDNNRFFCDKIGCVEECNSNDDLVEHIKSHLIPAEGIKTEDTNEKDGHAIFECSECKRPFFHEHIMTFHKLMHTPLSTVNETGYDCPSCDFNVYYRKGLIQHYAKNHSSHLKIYRCKYDKCNKTFTRERAYLTHTERCIFQTDVICTLCGKFLKDARTLYCHTRSVHAGIKQKRSFRKVVCAQFKCNQPDCDYTVSKIGRLRTHLFREHGIGEAIPCHVCGATFSSSGDVDRHVKHVHDERKFECPICKKKFPKRNTWEWHKENAHNPNQRPYVCQICGKSYRNTSGLRYHIGDKHTDEKKFSCVNCGKKYFRKDVYKLHEKNCKKNVVQQDGPDASTSSSNDVQGEATN